MKYERERGGVKQCNTKEMSIYAIIYYAPSFCCLFFILQRANLFKCRVKVYKNRVFKQGSRKNNVYNKYLRLKCLKFEKLTAEFIPICTFCPNDN